MFFCWILFVCLFIHYGSTVIPVNQHDEILPKSPLNNLSTIKYNNIHLKSKTKRRKVKENNGKVQEERKATLQLMPIAVDNRAKNYQIMANKEKETKQKPGYNPLDSKAIKEKSSELGIASQKEDKLLKTKKEAKRNTNKISTLALEESTLRFKKRTQIVSNSASKYNPTTVQNTLKIKAHSNSYPVSQIQGALDVSQKEIWFVSDEGSDKYNCQTESTPCKNLQTVLDRVSDGAEIYVTSETLS